MTIESSIKTCVANKGKSWKTLPVSIGKAAPKNFESLISFEELDGYSLVSDIGADANDAKDLDVKSPSLKNKAKKNRKKKRDLLKKKLQLLNTENSGASADDDQKKKFKRKSSENRIDETVKKVKVEGPTVDDKAKDVDMTAWKHLFVPDPVLKALAELGFNKPMPIQEQVLPGAIRDHRDVLGAAQTGSGKTLAFGIPLVNHLLENKRRNPQQQDEISEKEKQVEEVDDEEEISEDFVDEELQRDTEKPGVKALVLTPTRELAMQVKNHIVNICKYTDLHVAVLVGGMAIQKQLRVLSKCPDIVVATPGRLWEIIDSNRSEFLGNLNRLRYLVIDEADRMLEHGHFEDLNKLLEVLFTDHNKQKRQTFIFSATLTTSVPGSARVRNKNKYHGGETSAKLQKVMKRVGISKKPLIVDLTTNKVMAENLSEAKIICDNSEKDKYLYYFLKSNPGRTLVFTNSIDCIFHLAGVLDALQCQPLHLHAKMQQRQRLKHLDRFQQRDNAVLIASDVAARGLDIPDVKYVIHYQVPRTIETYIHRSGRSARSGKVGMSLLLVSPDELQLYKRVCHTLKKPTGLPSFHINDNYMMAIAKRVRIAKEIDQFAHKRKKIRVNNDWFRKAAEEADMVLDDDNLMKSDNDKEEKHILNTKRQQLNSLLKKPIFPKGFSSKYITMNGPLQMPTTSI